MAEGYVARLPSSVVLRSQTRTGQDAAALAEGIATLGQTLGRVADQNAEVQARIDESNHQIAMEQKRRQQSAWMAIAMGQVADFRLETQRAMAELRTKSTLGAMGHEEEAAKRFDELQTKLIDRLTQQTGGDPEVMDRITPMVANTRAAVLGDEDQWALGKRAEAQGMGVQKSVDAIAIDQQAKPDPQAAIAALIPIKQVIEASDWDGNTKAKVWDNALRTGFGGTLNGLIASGQPDAVIKMLDDGTLKGIFTDDEASQWRARAAAGSREIALAGERAASEARTAATDRLESIKVDIENGTDVAQSTVIDAYNAAKAAGVKDADLKRFDYLQEGAAHAQAMRAMTTPQLQADVAAMRDKLNRGQATAADQRRLGRAEKALDQRDAKDGESLSSLWKQGAQGQAMALAQLGQMPLEQRERVTAKMGQDHLAIVAGLRPETQRLALTGQQIRADREKDYLPPDRPSGNGKDQVRAAFDEIIGPAAKNGLAGQYRAMMDAAMDIYVGAQASRGATGGWERDGFEKAVKIAFGATRRPDGTWQGGLGTVRGRKVELPNRWNEAEFDGRVSRFDFAGAGAVYGTQAAVSNADVAANYQPVFDHQDADGTAYYRFEDRRGAAILDKRAKRVFLLPFADRGAR